MTEAMQRYTNYINGVAKTASDIAEHVGVVPATVQRALRRKSKIEGIIIRFKPLEGPVRYSYHDGSLDSLPEYLRVNGSYYKNSDNGNVWEEQSLTDEQKARFKVING